ncbi:MAG: sensor histidine kinase [Gemmatimonadota bacterium]
MDLLDRTRLYSLKSLLLLYVIVPLTAVLAGAGYLGYRGLEGWVESRMQEEVEVVARAIQEPLSRSMRQNRPGTVAQLLESVFALSQVYTVQVYGRNGEEIAVVGDRQPPRGDDVEEMLARGEEGGEYGRMGGREVYSYFASLQGAGGQPIGLLHLSRRRSDFDHAFTTLRWQSAGMLLGGGVLVLGLVLFGHHRSVGRHLQRLGNDMTRIEEGDRGHRASTDGPREIGGLARTLNAMLDSLERARGEIERRRDAQAELQRRLRRTEKLAAIGRLAGGVAHELGTPLSVISGKAQRLLRRDDLGDETRQGLREVREQVDRTEQIVSRLLEFGRRGESERRAASARGMVRAAVSAVEETFRMDDVSLEVERAGDDGAGDSVSVERGRMIRALANLLRNAAQATPGGEVRLTWEVTDAGAVFRVEDDGPGIDPDARDRLFEPFFTTKPVGEGTGLGLAVVHATAEDHGGGVRVGRSEMGGASFEVAIPRDGEGGSDGA